MDANYVSRSQMFVQAAAKKYTGFAVPTAQASDAELVKFAYEVLGLMVSCAVTETFVYDLLSAAFPHSQLAVYPAEGNFGMPMVRLWNLKMLDSGKSVNVEWEVDFYRGTPTVLREYWF